MTRAYTHPVTSLGQLAYCFSSDIWEVLLLNMNGMNGNKTLLNGPAWTLSSMLIAQFFIWGALYHFRDKFTDILLPLTVVVGLGVWRFVEQANIKLWIGFTTFGTFRVWIVLCLGYYTLHLALYLQEKESNSKGKWALTLVELACHGFAIWVIMSRDTRYYQWCCILAFLLATAIEYSGQSKFNEILNRFSLFAFLGELSMCIYLSHDTIRDIYMKLYPEPDVMYRQKFTFLFFVLLSALLMYYLTRYLLRVWRFLTKKLNACFTA